jgi:hypothetical protein
MQTPKERSKTNADANKRHNKETCVDNNNSIRINHANHNAEREKIYILILNIINIYQYKT